jgi:threonylcarbamoyladenosine tRNA methylthiotransferase MtaB
MKRVVVKTLGCKVNQCESEAIRNALVESDGGFTAGDGGRADVVIVNTCTVTAKAAMQSRQAVRRAVRAHPGARIVVTGCHAHTAGAELAAIDGVDLIVGNDHKHRIPEQILGRRPEGDITDAAGQAAADGTSAAPFAALPGLPHGRRTRPFLKIQDGCNAFCAYCIVPYARGRSRSMSTDAVIGQVGQLARRGYREVVLTGIHIGRYGQDLIPVTTLYDLLARIQAAGIIDRIRVSSIEPGELSDGIVGLAASDATLPGRLCPHFHIPLQSGDDTVLARMRRPYSADDFRQLVLRIVDRLPDAAIGVDTLIGFPGETDAAFERTADLIESLPVAYLHVFPFSARQGTPAFSYPDPVPAAVIKRRCERMRRIGSQKRRRFYRRTVGREAMVLVEARRGGRDRLLLGLTDNYVPVRFDGPDRWINTFQKVAVQGLAPDGIPEGRATFRAEQSSDRKFCRAGSCS